jgi:arylsulfatase A-like enzyme
MTRRNLLLISLEDMNDWIEPLGGHPDACTPVLADAASKGVTFHRAFAAAPACSPARTAALTGRHPWETGVYGNYSFFYDAFEPGGGDTLFERLRDYGYRTFCAGKVFHYHSGPKANPIRASWEKVLWDECHDPPPMQVKDAPLRLSKAVQAGDLDDRLDFGIDVERRAMRDQKAVDWLKARIRPGAEGTAWAIGIFRPHIPMYAPPEFFDMIPPTVSLPPGYPGNAFDPENERFMDQLPQPARQLVEERRRPGRILHKHGEYNDFLRAYLACIAYADALVGQVLAHLEASGLMQDTTVVIWSDHGWQLGEKLAFHKFTLWERALRVPFIVLDSRFPATDVQSPVSMVDMAPSIMALLGLPAPNTWSGRVLFDPETGQVEPGGARAVPSLWSDNSSRNHLAISLRTRRHRFIRYRNGAVELYDHAEDPFEHRNLARQADRPQSPGLQALIDALTVEARSIEERAVFL